MRPSKRKISVSQRSAFWPCGACRRDCSKCSILCDNCGQWYHYSCEQLDDDDIRTFVSIKTLPYVCSDCFLKEIGGSTYSYVSACMRLSQAASYGTKYLAFTCKREALVLPGVTHKFDQLITADSIKGTSVHRPSRDILQHVHLTSSGTPYTSTEDGNCLFSAVSIALTGDSTLTTELRVRTCIEMVNNRVRYMSLPNAREIILHSPDFVASCLDCAHPGSYSSQWTIYALSNAIGYIISVLYPPVNGVTDATHIALTERIQPFCAPKGSVSVMWTNSAGLRYRKIWCANHFVPLLPSFASLQAAATFRQHHQQRMPPQSPPSSPPASRMNYQQRMPPQSPPSSPPASPMNYQQRMPPQSPPSSPPASRMQNKQQRMPPQSPPSSPPASPMNYQQTMPPQLPNSSPPASPLQNKQQSPASVFPPDSPMRTLDWSPSPPGFQTPPYRSSKRSRPSGKETQSLPLQSTPKRRHVLVIPECSPVADGLMESDMGRHSECGDSDLQNHTGTDNEIAQIPSGAVPLPGGSFLSCRDIYQEVLSAENVLDSVPIGQKSNIFLKINNSNNDNSSRNVFYDDCGVWSSSAAQSAKTTHIISQGLRQVTHKNNQYCVKQKRQGSLQWIPLMPQPDQSDVLILHKYYTTLKRDPALKRRISWFSSPSPDSTIHSVALYEYSGEYSPNSEYQRTHPSTMQGIKDTLKGKDKRAQEIYQECVENNESIMAPRDTKQIQNIKYRESAKEKLTNCKNNIADDVLDIISIMGDHPYLQQVIHTKGNVPSIICYTDEQILDLRQFINSKSGKLGIDRTFNLGNFYVTTIVYKNHKVIRKDSKDYPIFLGPLYLHKEATYPVYREFFGHVSSVLECDVNHINIKIPEILQLGSDDEKALTKAIDRSFPGSIRTLCTKHLKDNIQRYITDVAPIDPKQKKQVQQHIFGPGGLIDANDTFEFEERAQEVTELTNNVKFNQYFNKTVKDRIRNYVFQPKRELQEPHLWTNNNSMNNVLKMAVNWKPQRTSDLIDKLYNVTKLQFLDLKRAMVGSGNYRLSTNFSHYAVAPNKWQSKSSEEKYRLFRNFLKDAKHVTKKKSIISNNGKLTIPIKAKSVAQKPGQRKRPRNSKTQTFH